MGRRLVLSLLGGIGGCGIDVCYSTHRWVCGRGSWGYGLGWFVALWTFGVGRAGGGVTRAQLCSVSFFFFFWAFVHWVIHSKGTGGLRVCDRLTCSLRCFLGLAMPEVCVGCGPLLLGVSW